MLMGLVLLVGERGVRGERGGRDLIVDGMGWNGMDGGGDEWR